MKAAIKRLVFGLLGKEPEAVVVSFLTGDPERARAMVDEVRRLEPDHRYLAVTVGEAPRLEGVETIVLTPGSPGDLWLQLHRHLARYRIGLAPILLDDPEHTALRRAACAFAPGRLLAYNRRGERHHLRLRTAIASGLFLRGLPLDRVWLRPRWLFPWKHDRTVVPTARWEFTGRTPTPLRPTVAVLSPYLPWPLAHGGAVRIFNLLREASREFDIVLLAFHEGEEPPPLGPLAEFCTRIVLVGKPRYREPRWSTLLPPEVCEYASPTMHAALVEQAVPPAIVQIEYTQLARYPGDILVEHDVTFDLYNQVRQRTRTAAAWWDWYRWSRFETRAVAHFRRVVVMSDKDAALLAVPQARTIANGVDLDRYRPEPEAPGARLLFIGSFRHFPNVVAYRYFIDEIWPSVRRDVPGAELTVVAGPDPELHWANFAGTAGPPMPEGVRLQGFVADVRPLYTETNVVVVPTLESAGTRSRCSKRWPWSAPSSRPRRAAPASDSNTDKTSGLRPRPKSSPRASGASVPTPASAEAWRARPGRLPRSNLTGGAWVTSSGNSGASSPVRDW